jgi:hypothetical protein
MLRMPRTSQRSKVRAAGPGWSRRWAEQHQQQTHQGHRRLGHQPVHQQLAVPLLAPVPGAQQHQQLEHQQHDQGEAEPAQQMAQTAEGGSAHRRGSRQIERTAQLYGR